MQPKDPSDNVLTTRQVSELVEELVGKRPTAEQIREWCRQGYVAPEELPPIHLEHVRNRQGHYEITEESVRRFIELRHRRETNLLAFVKWCKQRSVQLHEKDSAKSDAATSEESDAADDEPGPAAKEAADAADAPEATETITLPVATEPERPGGDEVCDSLPRDELHAPIEAPESVKQPATTTETIDLKIDSSTESTPDELTESPIKATDARSLSQDEIDQALSPPDDLLAAESMPAIEEANRAISEELLCELVVDDIEEETEDDFFSSFIEDESQEADDADVEDIETEDDPRESTLAIAEKGDESKKQPEPPVTSDAEESDDFGYGLIEPDAPEPEPVILDNEFAEPEISAPVTSEAVISALGIPETAIVEVAPEPDDEFSSFTDLSPLDVESKKGRFNAWSKPKVRRTAPADASRDARGHTPQESNQTPTPDMIEDDAFSAGVFESVQVQKGPESARSAEWTTDLDFDAVDDATPDDLAPDIPAPEEAESETMAATPTPDQPIAAVLDEGVIDELPDDAPVEAFADDSDEKNAVAQVDASQTEIDPVPETPETTAADAMADMTGDEDSDSPDDAEPFAARRFSPTLSLPPIKPLAPDSPLRPDAAKKRPDFGPPRVSSPLRPDVPDIKPPAGAKKEAAESAAPATPTRESVSHRANAGKPKKSVQLDQLAKAYATFSAGAASAKADRDTEGGANRRTDRAIDRDSDRNIGPSDDKSADAPAHAEAESRDPVAAEPAPAPKPQTANRKERRPVAGEGIEDPATYGGAGSVASAIGIQSGAGAIDANRRTRVRTEAQPSRYLWLWVAAIVIGWAGFGASFMVRDDFGVIALSSIAIAAIGMSGLWWTGK